MDSSAVQAGLSEHHIGNSAQNKHIATTPVLGTERWLHPVARLTLA